MLTLFYTRDKWETEKHYFSASIRSVSSAAAKIINHCSTHLKSSNHPTHHHQWISLRCVVVPVVWIHLPMEARAKDLVSRNRTCLARSQPMESSAPFKRESMESFVQCVFLKEIIFHGQLGCIGKAWELHLTDLWMLDKISVACAHDETASSSIDKHDTALSWQSNHTMWHCDRKFTIR